MGNTSTKVQFKNIKIYLEYLQQLTMETLFGRFPHLVEDILGLLNGKTLWCCGQMNTIWSQNLEEYRLHLVKKIQKHVKNQNIEIGQFTDYGREIGHNLPEILFEPLPLPFLVHLMRCFHDYKLKDCKRIMCIKPVLSGIFIKNEPNCETDVMVVSQKLHGCQMLKAEDPLLALVYANQVNFKLPGQPQIYNNFVRVLKELGTKSISTAEAIARVSQLFRNHPELIMDFITFFPTGYKIKVHTLTSDALKIETDPENFRFTTISGHSFEDLYMD